MPWWDRIFRTYRAQPEAGHDRVTLGLEQFRDPKELRIDRMLLQRFRASTTTDPTDNPLFPPRARTIRVNTHAP